MSKFSQGQRFRTKDSALAYYINQLENFDPKLYEPLTSVSWGRDIKLRTGITMSNESTSYIRSAFAGGGSLSNPATASSGGNMPWISAETTAIEGVSVNGEKIATPLRLLGREISYTSVELERSQLTGQPIDTQKLSAMNTLYQMNTDQMVYIGSSDVGVTGLFNDASVTSGSVSGGIWTSKTPDQILADVNTLVESAWQASAFAVCPSELRLPPFQFSYIASQKVSTAGNVSILKFLEENSISLKINGKPLNIQPVKWLTGRGTSSTDRMVAYTNEEDRARFTMVPIRRETAYYQGIRYIAPYIWAFGGIELVYPETVQYADGI